MLTPTRPLAVLVLACALTAGEPPKAPSAPPTAASYVTEIPAEFTATLFAKPPEVNYPVHVAAAGNGEVFVACDKNGSLGLVKGMGRIMRCLDADGDGIAEKITAFVPDIESPRGIGWDGTTLYCLHPPFVTSYRDRDGDGIAEETKVLAKGVGVGLLESKRGADHTSNGLRIGIDGWIYLAIGDFGCVKAEGADGSSVALRAGGVLRLRPDGSELELHCRGTRNIYDVAISPTLDCFTRDNTNDGGGWNIRVHHLAALAEHGYPSLYKNFSAETFPMLADHGGGSGVGGLYVQEPALPEAWREALFTCDWGTSRIYRHVLTPAAGSFTAEQKPFVKCDKVTDIDVDGRGRLYLASWKGGGFKFSNDQVGAVVRLAAPGATAPPYPDLAKASDAELVAHVGSGSAVLRYEAQSELLRRGAKPAVTEALTKLAAGKGGLGGRVAAIFTLKQLAGVASHPALLALVADASVREFALHALADRIPQSKDVPSAPFVAGLTDADPRVRMQAIVGLARLGRVDTAAALVPLARIKDETKGAERALPHIAVRALQRLNAIDACLAALTPDAAPDLVDGALWALSGMHDARTVAGLSAKLAAASDPALRKKLITTLARLYHREGPWPTWTWWSTRPDPTGPYYSRATWDESVRIDAALKTASAKDAESLAFIDAELKRHSVKLEWAGGAPTPAKPAAKK